MRNELVWQNTAAPGTAGKFAGWDGSGNPVEKDGGAVSFGTVRQVPYMNSTNDDFSYEAGYEYDAANNRLSAGNFRMGDSTVGGDRVIDFDGTGTPNLTITTINGSAAINFRKGDALVKLRTALQIFTDSTPDTYTQTAVFIGNQVDMGNVVRGVYSNGYVGVFGTTTAPDGGVGSTLIVQGGKGSAFGTDTITGGPLLLSGGPYSTASTGVFNSGSVLINTPAPLNGGTYGSLAIFNNSFDGTPSFEGGEKIIYIGNAVTVPTGNPSAGGFLYVEAGELKWRGSSGTVTTIAPA